MARKLIHFSGLTLTWAVWLSLAAWQKPAVYSLGIAIFGALVIIPLIFLSRNLLDRQPTINRAELFTSGMHYLVAIFIGAAILEAVRFGLDTRSQTLPWLSWLGAGLVVASGGIWLLAVFNLVIKGFGAPFALSLTRVIVTQWLYAWTRNPLVLSGLALLVGLGLWLQSWLFLAWLMLVLSPAILIYLRIFEERELEIRFGQSYLDYKSHTPMLF